MDAFFRRRRQQLAAWFFDDEGSAADDEGDDVFLPSREKPPKDESPSFRGEKSRFPSILPQIKLMAQSTSVDDVSTHLLDFGRLQPGCDVILLVNEKVRLFAHAYVLANASDRIGELLEQFEDSDDEDVSAKFKVIRLDACVEDVAELLTVLYSVGRPVTGKPQRRFLCFSFEIQFARETERQRNGGRAHYVMVSKIQWKPFRLATQLRSIKSLAGWQNCIINGVCTPAPLKREFPMTMCTKGICSLIVNLKVPALSVTFSHKLLANSHSPCRLFVCLFVCFAGLIVVFSLCSCEC